jgi:cytoskeletal protein RodZ
MAEINQTKALSAEEVKEPSSSSGFGAVLRSEREKKGLTLDQVASITKVRVKILDALENETWGDLPPPVFVRGFIRTYAGVLGLEGKELLHLYERVAPAQTVPGMAVTGKPVEVRRQSYKGLLVSAVIVALVLGVVTYLQVEHPVPSGEQLAQKTQSSPQGGEEKREVALTPDQAAPSEALPPLEAERAPGIAEPAPAVAEPAEQAMAPEAAAQAPEAAVETSAETASPDPYVLKAVVIEETWVRIHIDNGEAKEYIFQPGARPQWKAREGFHLTVGNAAGIELELNGTKLKRLGKPGKVVKRNLPESFRPTRSED